MWGGIADPASPDVDTTRTPPGDARNRTGEFPFPLPSRRAP